MTYAHELEKDLICIEESCVLCENLCDVFIDKLFNSKYKNDWDRLNRSLLNNNLTSKTKTI